MKQNNFKKYLNKYAESIDINIQLYLTDWSKEYAQKAPRLIFLLSYLQEASVGGKRVRGTLICLVYSLFLRRELSSKEKGAILQVAVAYEIFQTAILAHDDIIDQSAQRRDKPTLYQQLGGKHYGISQTISLGDLAFFMAYKIMAECDFPGDVKTKAIAFFSESITQTVLGQMLDVELTQKKNIYNQDLIDEIKNVYLLKTAYYTFVAPLTIGAILAGSDKKLLEQIKRFGENIGIVFQINDDIADIFEKQETSNKDRGADIKEGKITLLFAKAMQNPNPEQSRVLSKHYGKALIDAKDVAKIQKVFEQTGALSFVQTLADQLEKDARDTVTKMSVSEADKEIFEEIVDYVSGKEKIVHE